MTVNLGDKVKDTISGFVGIATGRSEYLYGCVRICVTPAEMKDGKPIDPLWFDEDQLSMVEDASVPRPESAAVRAGGPMPADARRDPVR